jgi:hypothetical protein
MEQNPWESSQLLRKFRKVRGYVTIFTVHHSCQKLALCHFVTCWFYYAELLASCPYRSRGPGFNSWHCQILWEVVGLEQGPLSLVSTTEELLRRNSSGFGLETQEYGCGDVLLWPHDTLCPQKLALTLPTRCGPSVGIVRSRTKATEFFFSLSGGCLLSSALGCAMLWWQIFNMDHGLLIMQLQWGQPLYSYLPTPNLFM